MQPQRIPPQSLEAEKYVLGSLLIDDQALVRVADLLRGDDFYSQNHKNIYEAMLHLFSENDPVDLLTVSNRMQEQGQLKQAGGRGYLAELSSVVATSANIVEHAKIVQKKATLRRLIRAAAAIAENGYNEGADIEMVLDQAQREVFGVSQAFQTSSFTPIKDVLDEAFDRIDKLQKNKGSLRGVSTGLKDLDNVLSGLQDSDLVILAARPSVGKTAFSLDILRRAAVKSGISVGFFSLEMSKEQLVDRLICAQGDVDLWKLRTGNLSDRNGDFEKIGQALDVLSKANIYIDDTAVGTVMDIRTKCRRLQAEHGLDLIVIDYLQLMESRNWGSDNRVQQVSEISRGLKQLARELNIPVLCLSQLNRAVEQTKPAIPKLSHLRESGSIEQDADVVMMLYRKEADPNYQRDEIAPEERNLAEVIVAKHRNGPTGSIKVRFNKTRATFHNLARHHGAPPPPTPGGQAGHAPPPPPPPIGAVGAPPPPIGPVSP